MTELPKLDAEKVEKRRRRWPILSCIFTALLTGMYALEIWERLNFTAVNVVCVSLFFLEFGPGLVEGRNKKKARLFLAAVFIGTVVDSLNLWMDYQVLGNFHIDRLSAWSLLWTVLLLCAVLSLAVILVRLVRWSQEQWEEHKKQRQERRLKRKASWWDRISSKEKHRQEMQEIRQEGQKQKLEARQEHQKRRLEERQETRQEHPKERLTERGEEGGWRKKNRRIIINIYVGSRRRKNGGEPEGQEGNGEPPKKRGGLDKRDKKSYLLKGTAIVAVIVGFFVLPIIDIGGEHLSVWTDGVKKIVDIIGYSGAAKDGQTALLYYLLLYIVVVTVILVIISLICGIIFKDKENLSDGYFAFLVEYQEPLATLIVLGAALYIFTGGKGNVGQVSGSLEVIVFIVLMALVIFVAIEMVRIILVQCAHADSLLRRTIHLTFIVILKFFSELLLGILTNLRIHEVITSLLMWVFPEQDSLNEQINRKLKQLFSTEIKEVGNEEQKLSVSAKFHRRRIWGRGK